MRCNCPDEPVLRPYQGVSFRYAMPAGWRAKETSHGVDMLAPDGMTAVSLSVLERTAGQDEPLGFVGWMLQQLGVTDARFLTVRPLAFPCCESDWRIMEVEAVYSVRGVALRSRWTCAVQQDAGRHTAILWGCQAPEQNWERRSRWLPRIVESIVLVNRRRFSLPLSACSLPSLHRATSPAEPPPSESAG